jgi:hypothetical protein
MREIKGGGGWEGGRGGDIIKLRNLHFLYPLFLPLSHIFKVKLKLQFKKLFKLLEYIP